MLKSNLKAMLEQRKISMRELSRRIDYRFETIRQLCNNNIKQLPVELIERICEELNCDVSDLFVLEKDAR